MPPDTYPPCDVPHVASADWRRSSADAASFSLDSSSLIVKGAAGKVVAKWENLKAGFGAEGADDDQDPDPDDCAIGQEDIPADSACGRFCLCDSG